MKQFMWGLGLPLAASAIIAGMAGSNPVVTVTGGTIQGRRLDAGAVFLGIPFAEPPVGELRWREPRRVKPWTGTRDAGEYGAPCAQIAAGWNDKTAAIASEDCLTLNVWTPEWPSKSPKAVMLWIHGGANMGGSALGAGGIEPPFDGAPLSRHGVVVVTINYRLGVLGFLAHPELSSQTPYKGSGNYGLMDQIAALRWVKENIARFGGNPSNVTVFGQSAGGNDIGLLLTSPLAKGLFHRAIEQSGTVVGSARLTPSLAEEEEYGRQIAARAGAPAQGVIPYLRKLPVADLLKASPAYGSGLIGPTVDGYVIPRRAADVFASGGQHRLPLMIGSNGRERTFDGDQAALTKAIQEHYGDFAPRVLRFYATPPDYPPYGDAGALFSTDVSHRCPAQIIAEWQSNTGSEVYMYEFTHAFPGSNRGAPHSGELRYVFGMLPGLPSEQEATISREMRTYWTNFAKTGNPNGGGLPVWPRFDPKTRRYIEFTDNGTVAKAHLRREACVMFAEELKRRMAR